MAVPLISHPFRLNPNGSIAARDDASTDYLAERIALILLTEPGERPLVPAFGVNDPAYSELSVPALTAQIKMFNIPVTIVKVTKSVVSDEKTDYTVEFDTIGGQ